MDVNADAPAGASVLSVLRPHGARAEEGMRQLEHFLIGFGWRDDASMDRVVERCLAHAAAAGATDANGVLDAVETAAAAWANSILGVPEQDAWVALVVARAAFLACDGARVWADHFLDDEPPAEFVAAMRAAAPAPLPAETPHPMAEQPFAAWRLKDLIPAAWLELLGRRSAAAA